VIQMTYTLNPIGHVARTESTAKIVVDPEFRQGLVHLNEFSHAIILWWIHERDNPGDRHRLLANPPRGKGTEPSGVFACRSPFRPNPPVLDIKPYLPSSDKVDDVEVAPWFANLERRYSD
jgi:tRNA (Thr-GGU) A37 N-methylase